MLRKKDYEAELAKRTGELNKRQNHTREELDAIGRNIPVRVMQNPSIFVQYCITHGLSFTDSFVILVWVISQFPFLNDVKVSNNVTYDEACRFYEMARVNTIVIHRLNYIMHEAMVVVYDILDRDGKMRFTVKRDMASAEKVWGVYVSEHRKAIERSAWFAMQDHMRLTNDTVRPYLEKVYETIRDYMIGLGMRDVELMSRCQVALLLMKVVGHSYRAFFMDFERECGVNFTKCFEADDLSAMNGHFAAICNTLGMRTEKDVNGFYVLSGFNPEQSQRFRWAWGDLMKVFRDDDAMDQAAQQAIRLNPEIEKEYLHVLAEKEQEMFEESVTQLSGKYNVSQL